MPILTGKVWGDQKIFHILLKIATILVILVIGVIVYDFSVNHGIYSFHLLVKDSWTDPLIQNNIFSTEPISVDYSITKDDYGNYKFSIKNKALFPYAYYGLQELEYIKKTDSLIFLFASHYYTTINDDLENRNHPHYYGCGTGLGAVRFNIGESNEIIISYDELINKCVGVRERYTSVIDSCTFDYIYQQPLFCGRLPTGEAEILNTKHISISDSLEVHFYIQLHNYVTKKFYNVYSNPIKVSYIDILKRHNENELENQEYWMKISN